MNYRIQTNFLKIDMKMGEMRIFYRLEEQLNMELDRDLQAVFDKHGLHRWASGFDLRSGIRDIAVDKIPSLRPVSTPIHKQVPSKGQAPPVIVVKEELVSDRKMIFTALADIDKRLKALEVYQGAGAAKMPTKKEEE